MDEKASGIVLRTHPLTETSLIVHWLTADHGRMATAAKGARRPKSPFRGKLDLFYRCDFSFARSRRSELHALREVSLLEMHAGLRRELGWLREAAYAGALIEQTTETETPLEEVFSLFSEYLSELPKHPPGPLMVFAFEMKLLAELGLAPNLEESKLSPGCRQILERCHDTPFAALSCLRPSDAQNGELRRFLHGFLIFHLGRIPQGRALALGDTKARAETQQGVSPGD